MNETNKHNEETGLEIAVIGMAGRFPGAKNIHEFWENLKNGVESITFFSQQELQEAGIDSQALQDPNYVRARGILADVEYFEPAFFNMNPGEAEIMDPQLRVFLECSWHALEDAGYSPHSYEGSIGVYAGNAENHYWVAKTLLSPRFHLLGKFKVDMLTGQFSTRVSYHLNLKGPSLSIRTACSTSLVTIHTACLALLSGECDMALAGGVSLALPQQSGYFYQEGMVAPPDGHCRAFDARAKGAVGGSGAGTVVLKKLEDALADHDHIYAVVKGTAINNDGLRKVGFTAPSVEGQAEAVRAATIMAEVEPGTISYIETHGTATELGDPVEIEALKMVFHSCKKGSIPIGSVKTNVGHLDAAAGVTGFIKTVLALKHRQIPPSLNFETPNPKIELENSPFYVNTELKTWENGGHPLRAGVSSFGLGGTNAHAVLEAWGMEHGARGEKNREYQLILLSAKTKSALEKMTENLVNHLKNDPGQDLADVAYTLQMGRRRLQHRRMVVCSADDGEKAVDMLAKRSKKVKTAYTKVEEPPVVFLLSGQGAQYVNMGLDLYRKEKKFREVVDRCAGIIKPLTGVDIRGVLYPPEVPDQQTLACQARINQTDITQPLLFAFEYALAQLLMKRGIKPRAMIGYSMGEYIAACLSGVFSLEDALKLVAARGQLMRKTPEAAMLSVPLSEEEITPLVEKSSGVSLAIVNGPSCIAAGTTEAIEAFENQMKEKRLLCAPINMFQAVHSPMMTPIRREFEQQVAGVTLNNPQIPYISNVSGDWITAEKATNPGYWGEHLCTTVRFSKGIKELLKEEHTVFIEIGPGRLLSNIVRHHMDAEENKKEGQRVVNIVKHQQEKVADDYYLLSKMGELWLYGVPIDWSGFYPGEKRYRVPLPTYPFEGKRYWIDGDPFKQLAEGQFPIGEGKPMTETRQPEPSARSEPGPTTGTDPGEYDPPRDELEQTIAQLWQGFLGFERIGIHDNFFEINGDSLTATQLITRLQQLYPVEISLQRFFEGPTIAQLADVTRELLVEKVKGLSEEELEKLADTL